MVLCLQYVLHCLRLLHSPLASGLPTLSFNEHKLAELAREEGSAEYRKRTGRMDKWRQVALEAAAERSLKQQIPDKIELLGTVRVKFLLLMCIVLYSIV